MTFSPVEPFRIGGKEETKTRARALLARFTFGKPPKQNLISVLSSGLKGQGVIPVASALWSGQGGSPRNDWATVPDRGPLPIPPMKLPQMNINENNTKTDIYQSLYGVNQCLQEVIWHIERLRTADVLKSGFAEVQRLAVEEIRSAINSSATNKLHTCESGDAFTYQKQRLALEQQLRDFQPQLEVVPKVDRDSEEPTG